MNRSFAAFVALSIALPAPSIHAAFVTTSYTGASGGAWSNALNWSNGIPDDGLGGNTYHAVIGPGLAVNMLSTIDVTQITLGLGAAIIVANDVDPTLNGGTITNDGVILMASTGNSTVLGLNAPNVVLSGSGSLEGFNQNALILSVNAVRRLTNSAGHTIRGSISIGFDNTLLTNDGVIEATDPDGISIDLGGSESSNFSAGILRGTNGATLTIVGSGIDATGGTIRADGGNVDINSSTIVGGTYMDANGGLLRLVGGSSSLVNPTIDTGSTLHAVNDNDPVVLGTVTNNGTFRLESTGNTTALGLNSTEVVFTGIGQLEGLNQNAVILSINAVRRLTNSVGHTILGSMSIGNNNTLLTNNGVIEATDPDGITIDLGGSEGSNFNTGVLGAMPGATLTIASTGLDNTGGTIIADGGTVDVNSSTIVNGFFTQANGGLLRTVGGASTLINPEIATGATLHVVNDNDPVLIGTVTNNGTISIESAGNATAIGLNSPDVFLEGDGTVEGLDQNAIFVSVGAVRRLTNAATHTMRGSMSIGSNNTLLTNNGLIEATDPDGITIDLGGSEGSNFNTGTLRAGPGATLTIAGTGLNNTGGTIIADGGTVDVNSSTIVNGFFTQANGGLLRTVGGASTLIDPEIATGATLHVVNDNDPVLIGTVTNNGTISIESAGNATAMTLNSPDVFLEGDGAVEGLNQNAVFVSVGAVRRLTNAATHTMRGSMSIGSNNTLLTNNGLIEATDPDGITIDLGGSEGSNFNTGTLRAGPGATLTIAGTGLDNTGGTIVGDGGTVDITSSTIVNGVLDSTGAGQLRLVGGSSTLGNVTIDAGATLHIVNDNDPVFINTITNNGLIASDAAGNSTVIQLNTPVVTLAGDGVLQGSNTQNNVIQSTGAVRRLVNGLGHAIRGSWALGTNNTNLTNQGAILADTDGGLTIDVLSDFQNEGLLAVTLAGSLAIQPGLFVQSGTFQVDSGLAATRNGGPIDQTAGVTSVNGALTVTGGSNFNLADGILTGGGTVTAALVNNTGGTIAPGSGPGQMTIIGSTTFGANATFATEIGGPQGVGPNDLLFTTGVATLAGTINVTRAGGYAPLSTEEFTVLVAGSRVGTFTSVVSCDPVEVTYTANSVKVRFPTSTGIVGDLNGDGIVNGLDLGILLGFWGPCPGTCCPGDLNGDGLVDGADFGVLLANWT